MSLNDDTNGRMTRERWERVEAILDEVLRADPTKQVRLTRDLCGGDDDLLAYVERLLRAADEAGTFLEESADSYASTFVSGAGEHVLGRYRILRELDHGGMGTVYLACRADGQFEQLVALKVVRSGSDSEDVVKRFVREREILARLQHPHVARLFDGGLTADGRPYFVMEYVDGLPITEYCASRALSLGGRLELFVTACRAVGYAHRNLIVHRDLKPSNVFVTDAGDLKLLDFGIAGVLDQPDGRQPGATGSTDLVLTPEYASPELLRGSAVTTASDIFQLGLLLYELVTGSRALDVRMSDGIGGMPTPERPSCRVRNTDREPDHRMPPVPARHLEGDLDAIIMKALKPDPESRYESVAALADDVERYLKHRPVRARNGRILYRAGRFVRRNRSGVVAALVFLVVAVAFNIIYMDQIRMQRDLARLEAEKATQSSQLFTRFFEDWNPDDADRGRITTADLLKISVGRARREMGSEPEVQAAMLSLLGELHVNIGRYATADTLLVDAFLRQQRLLGAPHNDLASTLARRGKLRYQQGRYDEAERFYRRAVEMYDGLYEPSHADVLRAKQGLASVLLQGQERFPEAEALLRDIISRLSPAERPSSAGEDAMTLLAIDATRALGLSLFFQARYQEAVGVLEPALDRSRRLFGSTHPVTILTMQALAATIRDLGRLGEAIELQREVLQANEQIYGEDHADALFARYTLAFNLHRAHVLDEAEAYATDVYTRARALHGQSHPATARYQRLLGFIYMDQGRYDDAETTLRAALEAYRETLSYRHADEAGMLNRLAYIMLQKGGDGAQLLFDDALLVHRSRPSDEPMFVTYAPHYLAAAMELVGDGTAALQLYRDLLPTYRAQLPAEHPYRRFVESRLIR